MKLPSVPNRRGMALVVVLVFLVLLSIFVVGFFSNSQDELTAAQSFTGEVSASHLSESAVSVVMGQIREATSRTKAAWGSQPGMIRVYGDKGTASGKADAFFKLYSSDDMVVSGNEITTFDPTNDVAEGANGWQKTPALWTNLNEEVTVDIPTATGTVAKATRYPILDPSLENRVEGLEFITNSAADATSNQRKARMPVRWLYMLKDGTLTAPSSSAADGTQAVWDEGERAPTPANPIVGRVGFWTDDESCKVNINTAGGYSLKKQQAPGDGGMPDRDDRGNIIGEDDYAGSYWDTPRAFTVFDRGLVHLDGAKGSSGEIERGGLALSQPVRGEFQRYPGHPSTTSLGIVFRGLKQGSQKMQDAPYLLRSGQLALLAPRLQFSFVAGETGKRKRGSDFGADRFLSDTPLDSAVLAAGTTEPLPFRVKRLYASVDELFYAQPDKLTGNERKQTDWELAISAQNDDTQVLTPAYLEKMRFFLTAHSRSPELNLFGQPRVTIWPVSEVTGTGTAAMKDEADRWNASDRLIAFCSTIGPDATQIDERNVLRYIFQRKPEGTGAYSASADFAIPRNKAILSYLRTITSEPFPGFGGPSFETKYQGEKFGNDSFGREQLLVEIFDYIRTVNLRDSTRDKETNKKYPPKTPGGSDYPPANILEKEKYRYAPRGLVVPTRSDFNGGGPNARHGFGRFPTISEASIVLYCSGFVGTDSKRYLNSRLPLPNGPRYVLDSDGNFVGPQNNRVRVKDTLIRAFFITETFNPMQGFAPTATPNGSSAQKLGIVFEIENLNEFKLGTRLDTLRSLAFPQKNRESVLNEVIYSSGSFWGGRNSGGSEGFMHTMWAWPSGRPKAGVAPNLNGLGGAQWYPYQSNPLDPAMVDSASGIHGLPIQYETEPDVPRKTVWLSGPSQLKVKMYFGQANSDKLVRDIVLNFGEPIEVPIPTDEVWSARYTGGDPTLFGTYGARVKLQPSGSTFFQHNYQADHPGGFIEDPKQHQLWACNRSFQFYGSGPSFAPRDRTAKSLGDWIDPKDPSKSLKPGRLTWVQNDSANHMGDTTPGPNYERRWQQILQPGDVIRSVVYGNAETGKGDLRVSCLAVDSGSASSVFAMHPDYKRPFYNSAELGFPATSQVPVMHAQSLRMSDSQLYFPDAIFDPASNRVAQIKGVTVGETRFGNIAPLNTGDFYPASQSADLPFGINGVSRKDEKFGDFDTGIGSLADGPYCNKADEGNLAFRIRNNNSDGSFSHWTYPIPYFTWAYEDTFDTFFSPNRQVPSPVVFGSLLSGKGADWQTLCFSPNPAGNFKDRKYSADDHPGRSIKPKDYLWLDLFNMPVVEPYAISEPFSTAGKINLNYPIVPFSHIKRSTGLRAALQPVRVTGLPVADVKTFKTGFQMVGGKPDAKINYRYLVNRDETLKAFDAFFDAYKTGYVEPEKEDGSPRRQDKGFFKSAAQICDFYLYPKQGTKTMPVWAKKEDEIKKWWADNALTGDNVREKPYGDLYARITTKSNTFCVHVRAQSLRQSGTPDPTKAAAHYRTWDEKRDRVVGEYRGASIIERYIDPQDVRFDTRQSADKTVVKIRPDTESIDSAYRFRVLSTKRFDP